MDKIDIKQKIDALLSERFAAGYHNEQPLIDNATKRGDKIESEILDYMTNLERERDELKPKEGYYKPSREGRRQGNTTRRADEIIQNLFDGQWVALMDHYWKGKEDMGDKGNAHIADLIMRRLAMEHKLRPEHFKVYGAYELELKPEYVASYKTESATDGINK